jgi:hypothetical protein
MATLPDISYGPAHSVPAFAGRTKVSGDTTAGATTSITGATVFIVDRRALPKGRRFGAVTLNVNSVFTPSSGTTTGAKTVTINAKIQHRETTASAGSTWANLGTTGITKVHSATTAAGQAQQVNTLKVHRSLEAAGRFLRAVVTRAFSSTATGQSLEVFGHFDLWRAESNPATSTSL